MTHDLRVMIIAYRLHTCCTNSRHVATHNGMSPNLLQYKVACFVGQIKQLLKLFLKSD